MARDTFEDRLRALAARGFSIDLRVYNSAYGKNVGTVGFDIRLNKGTNYAGSGMSANGTGASLDEATNAALRAAEAFLVDPEPQAAVEAALGDMALALPAAAE